MRQFFLDDDFPDHPKVAAAGGDAAWLYVCALGYASRHLTRGRIPKAVVGQLSDRRNPSRLASRLVDVGLWHDEGDHYMIHDYGTRNAQSIARREKAQKAARTRWEQYSADAPSNAQPMLRALPQACSLDALEPTNQRTNEPPPPPTRKSRGAVDNGWVEEEIRNGW